MVNFNRPIMAAVLLVLFLTLGSPMRLSAAAETAEPVKQLIYDEAGLLQQDEYDELNLLANQYGAERETDMIIVTYNVKGYDVMKFTQDFYDEMGPGFDKRHGNAVILSLNMSDRELYLAGFYKSKTYLSGARLNKIRDTISSDLTDGNYKLAFQKYIEKAHRYMGVHPSLNPDLFVFNVWVQLGFSLLVGWIIVKMMLRRSGSRKTVDAQTYEDGRTSGVLDYEDKYLHTSTSSRKIESSSSSSSSSSDGGGTTSDGHSHSGSRGSF